MASKRKVIGEGLVGAAAIGIALLTPFLHSRRVRWGATDAEVNRSLPGDDLVPYSKGGYTHAITIRASAADIWPWMVQLGQGRGGFYSYDFLENLVGCNIHSVDRIVPEFQHNEASEGLRLHPQMPPMPVATIESGRTLLFSVRMDPDTPLTWLFFLEEPNERTTRLIVRWLFDYKPSLLKKIGYGFLLESIACVMGRKMLLGIKQRAEAAGK